MGAIASNDRTKLRLAISISQVFEMKLLPIGFSGKPMVSRRISTLLAGAGCLLAATTSTFLLWIDRGYPVVHLTRRVNPGDTSHQYPIEYDENRPDCINFSRYRPNCNLDRQSWHMNMFRMIPHVTQEVLGENIFLISFTSITSRRIFHCGYASSSRRRFNSYLGYELSYRYLSVT
ncbi:hypothetical protein F5Y05DRAFT_322797 [Hypoxylon sp. FL0543]|nr:hypothetical protein F5Y05DRAFT_322797 [Hypoxylon sp. FL0543]